MNENHQDKIESKLTATEDKLSPPPLSTKDHRKPHRPQNNRMGRIIKWLGVFGYDKETKEYTPDGQPVKITKEHQQGKTIWDWLQLIGVLLIPLVIFLATTRFNQQQADLAQQQHSADQQRSLDQQHATILQTYMDNIQNLLLHTNIGKSKPTDDIAILARAQTLTALQGLDYYRKGLLVQFLYEAHLIGFLDNQLKLHDSIITLNGANLFDVYLGGSSLRGVDFKGAILQEADLDHADLSYANLSCTTPGVPILNGHGASLGITQCTLSMMPI